MRLLFVVDGRSPIALNWISHFVKTGHDVHLVTTFPCEPELSLASLTFIPVAFSGIQSSKKSKGSSQWMINTISGASFVNLRTSIRHKLGPFTLHRAKTSLQKIIDQVNPQLIHAMRIPYEGMLAALAVRSLAEIHKGLELPPLLVSVWGNDFTLHAPSSRLMTRHTHDALSTVDALHTDCLRDQRMAYEWGFRHERPAIVLPGGGGVNLNVFSPPDRSELVDDDVNTVINPRGVRAYVRNDTFFKSVKLVLKNHPRMKFICTGMAGDTQIQAMVDGLGIDASVELLPKVPYFNMPELYKAAQIAVSPSTHDGTPNTLLESMASGCFPIAGDIESLREWIIPGENGLLINPDDPLELSEAILLAIRDGKLRSRAMRYNTQLIAEKASYQTVMTRAEKFYRLLIAAGNVKDFND